MALDETPHDKNSGDKQVVKGTFPNKATQFKPGQSGNPAGPKPGYKHISTHIQEMLDNPKFLPDNIKKNYGFEGRPIEAVVYVAMMQAMG